MLVRRNVKQCAHTAFNCWKGLFDESSLPFRHTNELEIDFAPKTFARCPAPSPCRMRQGILLLILPRSDTCDLGCS